MITTINEYKYTILESKFKAYLTIEKILLLTEDNAREFEWDLTNDIKDDIKLIDQLNLGKEKIVKYFKSLIDKIHALPEVVQIKLFKGIVIAFMGLITLPEMLSTITTYFSNDTANTEIVNKYKNVVVTNYKKSSNNVITTPIEKEKQVIKKYVQPTEFSDTLVEFLKYEEGSIKEKGKPVLTAYNIGDGMITIGYGHAERKSETKMRANRTTITEDQALDLLLEDIKEAQGQLDNILNDWKKQGIKLYITQGMYDSMISMIYNMGIGNFRKSEFIQLVKNNKFDKAQEKIKTTNVTYPGHVTRREKEAKLFSLTNVENFNFNT